MIDAMTDDSWYLIWTLLAAGAVLVIGGWLLLAWWQHKDKRK